jgi:cytoskeletal protein CcmA (bactofilin family)
MFGSSKSEKSSSGKQDLAHLTGLERAKLERSNPIAAPAAVPQNNPPRETYAEQRPVAFASPAAQIKRVSQGSGASGDAAHLQAGPGVTLKGEITGCDTLRIEGSVEGNATARQLVICPTGSFLGTAEIEEAEVEGKFEGTLNVSGRLFLRSTGRIAGTLTYGQIEVERGGEILGDVLSNGKEAAVGKIRQKLPEIDRAKATSAATPPPTPVQPADAAKAHKTTIFGRS